MYHNIIIEFHIVLLHSQKTGGESTFLQGIHARYPIVSSHSGILACLKAEYSHTVIQFTVTR